MGLYVFFCHKLRFRPVANPLDFSAVISQALPAYVFYQCWLNIGKRDLWAWRYNGVEGNILHKQNKAVWEYIYQLIYQLHERFTVFRYLWIKLQSSYVPSPGSCLPLKGRMGRRVLVNYESAWSLLSIYISWANVKKEATCPIQSCILVPVLFLQLCRSLYVWPVLSESSLIQINYLLTNNNWLSETNVNISLDICGFPKANS